MNTANDNYHPKGVLSDAIIAAQLDIEELIEAAAASSGAAGSGPAREATGYIRDAVTHLNAAAFMIASGEGKLSSPEVRSAINAAFDMVVELDDLLDGAA
jgi:hypothetical protein